MNSKLLTFLFFFSFVELVDLRRVYSHIPSQKWDSESIFYTTWLDKNLKKINHSEGAENIGFIYQ